MTKPCHCASACDHDRGEESCAVTLLSNLRLRRHDGFREETGRNSRREGFVEPRRLVSNPAHIIHISSISSSTVSSISSIIHGIIHGAHVLVTPGGGFAFASVFLPNSACAVYIDTWRDQETPPRSTRHHSESTLWDSLGYIRATYYRRFAQPGEALLR